MENCSFPFSLVKTMAAGKLVVAAGVGSGRFNCSSSREAPVWYFFNNRCCFNKTFSHKGKMPTTKVIQKKLNRVCHDNLAPYNQCVSNQLPKVMGTRCQHICRNSLPTVHFSSR